MSVVGNKDTKRMEVVRYLDEDEDLYYSVMNRPVEDIEQRTIDLDRQVHPGKAFQVHQTAPASLSVQVNGGWYMRVANVFPRYWPEAGDTDEIAIPVAGAGLYRCDLITFDPALHVIERIQGSSEANWANAWTNRARVPAGSAGRIPLAYVYVDDSGTLFNDTIAVDNPGHIRDVRVAFGAGKYLFEEDPTVFLSDNVTASVGTSGHYKIARADHRHPALINATLPQTIAPDTVAGDGSALVYAKNDHVHPIQFETAAANLRSDTDPPSLGSRNYFVRSDHQHPLNVKTTGGTLPADPSIAQSIGVSTRYSRHDHTHYVQSVTLDSEFWWLDFVNVQGPVTTFVVNFNEWLWTWIVYSGNHGHGSGAGGGPWHTGTGYHNWMGAGFSFYRIKGGDIARATGMLVSTGADESNTHFAVDFNSNGGQDIIAGSPDENNNGDNQNGSEAPYDVNPWYINYGSHWEFSEDTNLARYGWNARMTTANPATNQFGITASKPIWAQFDGILIVQGD